MTLPIAPSVGDRIDVVCAVEEYQNKTILGNGNTILGEGVNYNFNSNYESITIVWSGLDWIIV